MLPITKLVLTVTRTENLSLELDIEQILGIVPGTVFLRTRYGLEISQNSISPPAASLPSMQC